MFRAACVAAFASSRRATAWVSRASACSTLAFAWSWLHCGANHWLHWITGARWRQLWEQSMTRSDPTPTLK